MHVTPASSTAAIKALVESTAIRWVPAYPQPNLLSPTAVGEAGGSGGSSGSGGDNGGKGGDKGRGGGNGGCAGGGCG